MSVHDSAVLVTGAAGFIGAAVAEALMARGQAVIGIDNMNDYYPVSLKRARLDRVGVRFGNLFQFRELDFADMHALSAGLEDQRFGAIIHLGAQAGVRYSLENPQAYVASNLAGHVNMLELARAREVRHMVYASSSSVYGGNTKLMSETYAHLFRIPLTGLRFFTVYGPWGRPDMAMWKFADRILSDRPIDVYNHGEMHRDFTYIDDIVGGVLACLDRPPADDGEEKAGGICRHHRTHPRHRLCALDPDRRRRPALRGMVPQLSRAVTGRATGLDLTPLGFKGRTEFDRTRFA